MQVTAWSIDLDEASQDFTHIRTHFGRYCYKRLPFCLCVSQDLFQQAMDRILVRTPGCVGIADDVVVYGNDNAEHDKNLLRLNAGCQKGRYRIQFQEMRHQDQQGRILRVCVWQDWNQARPEQNRRDSQDAYTPHDKADLQRFIGLMNYLAAFIPHLAYYVLTLR